MPLTDNNFFAEKVHSYIVYEDIQNTLTKYRNRMSQELKLRNLPKDYFIGKTILDIGTGFQALVAIEMGAQFAYHLDQSDVQITWMQTYLNEKGITNIASILCDITKSVPVEQKIDIALVFGVWHHLNSPEKFIHNLIPSLNLEHSEIWLRVYRSGSWSRWLVSHLRELCHNIDPQEIAALITARYPYNEINQWKGDLLDDLFAPTWQAFHPQQFELQSISNVIHPQNFNYDFSDLDENFRIDYHINQANLNAFKSFSFPNIGINQSQFQFNKQYHKATSIQNLFSKLRHTSHLNTAYLNMIVSIYELVRRKPIVDIYSGAISFEYNPIDIDYRLNTLTHLLKTYVREN